MGIIAKTIGHRALLKPLSRLKSQRAELTKLLRHADTHVPFYQGRFTHFLNTCSPSSVNDAAFFKRFAELPIVTKDDLRARNDDFTAEHFSGKCDILQTIGQNNFIETLYTLFLKKNFKIPISTGGTSGEPTYRWLDYRDGNAMAQSFLESFHLNGWQRGEAFVLYYPLRSYFTGTYAAFNDWLHRLFGFTVVPFETVTPESVRALLDTLQSRKATLLVIFPCVMQRVAEIMREEKIPPFRGLKTINVSGEFFFDCSKAFIQEMFPDSRIEITYGAVEIGEIAHQTENSSFDYQVFRDFAYVENGGNDTMLVTSLRQYGFPMIRYQMEDKAEILTQTDGVQYLRTLEGKNTDYLIGADGGKYYASHFNRFVNDLNPRCDHRIIHFMMRHEGTRATLYFVLKEPNTNTETIIERESRDMMLKTFPQFKTVQVKFPAHFDHDYTRKFKIISEGDGLAEVVGGYYIHAATNSKKEHAA
ncbi:MAG: hypothetical protein ACK4VI_02510 [Alphaproteobacteria bacterium]